LSFIGSLVLASIILHRNRKDLRGAKYNSGMDPDGNPLPQAGNSVAMSSIPDPYSEESSQEYYQK
jgi:hypothetical protein